MKKRLTPKQEAFCQHYMNCRNATQAYALAYGVSYNSAGVGGHHLLKNPKIQERLGAWQQELADQHMVNVNELIDFCVRVAHAQLTDYVKLDGGQVTATDWQGLDPQVIEDVKNTRDGLQVKLYSKEWAWGMLAKVLGFTDEAARPLVAIPAVVDEKAMLEKWIEELPLEILRELGKLADE